MEAKGMPRSLPDKREQKSLEHKFQSAQIHVDSPIQRESSYLLGPFCTEFCAGS